MTDDMDAMDADTFATQLATLEREDQAEAAKTVVMLDAALWYATKLHWPIFPLKPNGKHPLTRHGFKDASTDPEQIRAWWTRWPNANIGTPTGADGCGLDVIDVDGLDGVRAWANIRHSQCPPQCTGTGHCDAPGPFTIIAKSYTPGDPPTRWPGRHIFIPVTGRGNTTGLAGQKIDFRGAGGFVVIPPSTNPQGDRYKWIEWPTP